MDAFRLHAQITNRTSAGLLIGCWLSLLAPSASYAVQIQEPGPDLPPAAHDSAKSGAKWSGRLNGDRQSLMLNSVRGNRLSLSNDWGCSWERPDTPGWPGEKWSGCRSDDGALHVELEGQVFPVKVGNKWRIKGWGEFTGGSSTYNFDRTCEVVGTATVSVPAGRFETFHISCDGLYRSLELYWSPDLNLSVYLRTTALRRGDVTEHELVKY